MQHTSIPTFNYTFAANQEAAIAKVRLKFGEFDTPVVVREITPTEMETLVIGTDYFG